MPTALTHYISWSHSGKRHDLGVGHGSVTSCLTTRPSGCPPSWDTVPAMGDGLMTVSPSNSVGFASQFGAIKLVEFQPVQVECLGEGQRKACVVLCHHASDAMSANRICCLGIHTEA